MSMTFTKLFSSITESTIWVENNETRIVWIAMLAMADRRGRVWGSVPGLANRARVSVEGCRKAIALFLSPDPDSRTKVAEGRRIEEIDGGWRLINHEKYRSIRDQDETRVKTAERVKKHREKKRNVTLVTPSNDSAEAEAEAEAKTDVRKERAIALPEGICPQAWAEFVAHRRGMKKPLSALSAQKNINVLMNLSLAQQREAVDTTIANNWTGLFSPKGNHGNQQGHSEPRSAVDRVRAASAKREAEARAAGRDY